MRSTENHFATAAPAPQRNQDLSPEIADSLDRKPGDRVTCVRISGDYYRCNWWATSDRGRHDNPLMAGLLVTTHRVRQSRFLHVTKPADKLIISGMNA